MSPAGPQSDRNLAVPCAVSLAAQDGVQPADEEIGRLQREIRQAQDPRGKLERLGWLFVAKARTSHDPGYYQLAEQTARCVESRDPDSRAALLLRGHALHNLHRFREAEEVARRLIAERGSPFDYGLLGDALMEQGRLDEAMDAYQTMVDLKPGLQSYSRAAQLQWLMGDLEGATALMRVAARSGGPRNAEPVAWAYARLALLELQRGATKQALRAATAALDLQSDYAPALLARGRILLAKGKPAEAVEAFSRAAVANPTPEYDWWLAEALCGAGQTDAAQAIEEELRQDAAQDGRTVSLYLATRKQDIQTALDLARRELAVRQDVFTHDALAWALHAAGRSQEARCAIESALAEGTQDARLFFHAGAIAAATGGTTKAQHWLERAHSMRQMLLPSEQQQLASTRAALPNKKPSS